MFIVEIGFVQCNVEKDLKVISDRKAPSDIKNTQPFARIYTRLSAYLHTAHTNGIHTRHTHTAHTHELRTDTRTDLVCGVEIGQFTQYNVQKDLEVVGEEHGRRLLA